MKVHSILPSLVAAMSLAFTGAAAAHDVSETVKPNFSRAIPNIPGKSLTAVEVVYPPAAPHVLTHMPNRHSFTHTSSQAVWSAR
ncbi:hypothetical protein PPGU19_071430 (plasmid) [Paraburkholderia sp. PGU19]|nr:hypothetical protein PPGU19_071430 [Paraburkholderia sp. PGU19]